MDDIVDCSYTQISKLDSTLGGLGVAGFFTSTLENFTIFMGTKSSPPHPLKIPSFNSIKVNTPFMI